MNIMHGDIFLAFSNNFLTLEAPKPANISINSDPLIDINGTPASPATAFAINVFPVPGLPQSNIPFGTFAPIVSYLFGFLRKSTISTNSFFSSSNPAMSLNLILVSFSSPSYIFFSPPNPCILYNIKNIATNTNVGINCTSTLAIFTSAFVCFCINLMSFPF